MSRSENPYIPMPVKVEDVVIETDDKMIKTFSLRFRNEDDRRRFDYVCGQFAEIFVPGEGEAPFGMASSPMDELLQFTVSKAGVARVVEKAGEKSEKDKQ